MRQLLASFGAGISFSGENSDCVFSGAILVEQTREDSDPPTSVNVAVTFDRSVYDAITAAVRWTGSRIVFDDLDLVLGRGMGVTFEESMTPAEQATMKFTTVGDRWAIPSRDFVPPEPSTCPVAVPVSARRSPRSLGNKPTTLHILLGASPAKMQVRKIFQGMSLQKPNRGAVQVIGEVTSVDDGALYANVPLCYQIPPFAGLRRDEIVRQVAANVGLDPVEDVICPIGKIVTKPILLTNASLLPFLNELGAPENWLASFNADGKLFVRAIERKDAPELPDWTLDEAEGDFDLDSFDEVPPQQPATKIIIVVSQPVSGTGPGGSNSTVTTRTIEEIVEFYAPECVKVRPSGGDSFLYGDGSYRTIAEEELLLISRKVTDVTTVNGKETLRTVTRFQYHNPNGYDPNFDTNPIGTDYDEAYGNKSFHRDEAESLMEVSFESFETVLDIYGTILGTVEIAKGWYAPKRGLTFHSTSRTTLLNDAGATPPSYIYAGGTSRVIPAEVYGVVSKVVKDYQYAADGTLASVQEVQNAWYSPDGRCDITVDEDDDVDVEPDDPPHDNPPPDPPPSTDPNWYPQISGPVAQEGGTFTFRVSIAGGGVAPNPGPLTTEVSVTAIKTTGSIPAHGLSGAHFAQSTLQQRALLIPGTEEEGYAKITFSGPKPVGTVYVGFQINRSGNAHGFSNNLIFDPWQNVPPGGSL